MMRGALPLLLVLVTAIPARGQSPVPAVVDYIAQRTLYLQLANGGDRWRSGDTVRVGRLRSAYAGSMRIIAATERRLAGEWLADAIPFATGDSVHVTLIVRADSVAAARDTAVAPVQLPAVPSAPVPARAELAVHGSAGLDVTAMRSSRTDGPVSSTILSVARMNADVVGLPGGIRARASVRGTLFDDMDAGSALHVYAAEIEREFEYAQLRAGRFWHALEPYGGFIDGVSARIGRTNGPGAGVVYGFDARNSSELRSAGDPRVTAFADAAMQLGALSWRGDASLHRVMASDSARTFVGLRQHLLSGALSLTHVMRADRESQGWQLTILDVAGNAQLDAGWHLGARYALERPDILWQYGPDHRRSQRVSANVMWLHGATAAGADASASWTPLDTLTTTRALALNAWADIAWRALALEVNSSVWTGEGMTSVQFAPAVRFNAGSARVRTSYRLYRSSMPLGPQFVHGADMTLMLPFRYFDVDARLFHEQGRGLMSTRLLTGLWLRL
jgi:hypothetical protein